MVHALPILPYTLDALAPVLSLETLEYHFSKHHAAYVDNLNKLIVGTPFENSTIEEIVRSATGPIFNNAAQIWNHTFYFQSFASIENAQKMPTGPLLQMIEKQWQSFENFKTAMISKAAGNFGSGWTWLVITQEGILDIVNTSNAETPLTTPLKPLITLDVWEHAYYIDYRNRRAQYLTDIWQILDWAVIEQRLVSM